MRWLWGLPDSLLGGNPVMGELKEPVKFDQRFRILGWHLLMTTIFGGVGIVVLFFSGVRSEPSVLSYFFLFPLAFVYWVLGLLASRSCLTVIPDVGLKISGKALIPWNDIESVWLETTDSSIPTHNFFLKNMFTVSSVAIRYINRKGKTRTVRLHDIRNSQEALELIQEHVISASEKHLNGE